MGPARGSRPPRQGSHSQEAGCSPSAAANGGCTQCRAFQLLCMDLGAVDKEATEHPSLDFKGLESHLFKLNLLVTLAHNGLSGGFSFHCLRKSQGTGNQRCPSSEGQSALWETAADHDSNFVFGPHKKKNKQTIPPCISAFQLLDYPFPEGLSRFLTTQNKEQTSTKTTAHYAAFAAKSWDRCYAV